MLARAGFDVHFLLRSEYAVVSQHGLRVNSHVHGQLHLQPVQAYASAADMPPCDWLLVGTKSTGNVELAPTLAQVAAPDAKVVLLQNGLDVEDSLRKHLPPSLHLLGGLCYIGVHRSGPGIVEHRSWGASTWAITAVRRPTTNPFKDHRRGRCRLVSPGRHRIPGHGQCASGALAQAGVERALQRPLCLAGQRHHSVDGGRIQPRTGQALMAEVVQGAHAAARDSRQLRGADVHHD